MTIETQDLRSLMLSNSISELRSVPEYVAMCNAHADGLSTIQNAVNYLSNVLDKDKANGIWLDYIGALVGLTRTDIVDVSKYFCVNITGEDEQQNPTGDINKSKFFYFPTLTSLGTGSESNLQDDIFLKQINSKIAYNVSNGTREDNIKIIKGIANADNVHIYPYSPMLLDIVLYGEDIDSNNIEERIEKGLYNGIGVHEVTIYSISYETIEQRINTILEITGITGDYTDYNYEDIDEDLDEILELESE